jgi:O-antigen/teichoic acid export membrane protein
LFGHVTWYGFGNLLQRASGVLLLPAYVSQLSPEEFGALALISLLPFILPAVLSLGLPHAIMRYYHEWSREGDAAGGLSSVWIVCVGSLLSGTFLLDQFGRPLVQALVTSVPFDPDLRLGIWWAFWSGVGMCPLFLLRVLERSKVLLWVSMATAAFSVGFTLVAIYGGWGVRGIVLVQLVGTALVACGTTLWFMTNTAWPPRWGRLSQALRFGLPLVPSAVFEAAANRADRFFLDKWAALHDIGLYSMANQIGQAVKLFYDSVKPAWFPFYIRVAGERADAKQLLGGAVALYLAALTLAALAVLLLAVPVLGWFGFESRYAEAIPLIPLFVLGYYLFGLAPLGTAAVQVGEKTAWQPLLQFVHVAIVIGTNMVLTRLYGVWGAAWALVICYGSLAGLYLWAGHHAYAISMQWARMAAIVAAGAVVGLAGVWWSQERVIEKSVVLVLFTLSCVQFLRIDNGPLAELLWLKGRGRMPKI